MSDSINLSDLNNKLDDLYLELVKKYANSNDTRESLTYPHLVKVSEELGELSEQILKRDGYQRSSKGKFDKSDLETEFVDVIFSLFYLAKNLDLDIGELIEKRLKREINQSNLPA